MVLLDVMSIATASPLWCRSMGRAIELATLAAAQGDVPVGALVLAPDCTVLGEGYNHREIHGDPLAHAEMLAIRQASMSGMKLPDDPGIASTAKRKTTRSLAEANGVPRWNLSDMTLVVTLEPCPMCAGAALASHVGRIVFGAWDPKMGACGSVWDIPRDPHIGAMPEVIGGVREEECTALLNNFFRKLR